MQRFKQLSLGQQLPLLAAASALLVGLCLIWLAATSSAYLQSERESLYGKAVAEQVSATVREALQRGDLLSARASLQRFVDSSLATGISIRDVEGMAMGTAGTLTDSAATQYRAAIRMGEDILGEVIVSVDGGAGRESRWRLVFSLLALAAALSLLVFMATRYLALQISATLRALQSQLLLPGTDLRASQNELLMLQRTVEALPLDMLRGHAPVPAAATEYQQGTLLFVHLASLVRYVDTLGESNLHRYTRRLQQIVQAAAQSYRGQLSVTRPFGLLVSFSPQPNAGSEALRAASCARLIAAIAEGLQERTRLSLQLCMALDQCEQSSDRDDDIYPQLYREGAIDELRDACLRGESFPEVLLSAAALADEQLAAVAELKTESDPDAPFQSLASLSAAQESLIAHQAKIIIERIKPARG